MLFMACQPDTPETPEQKEWYLELTSGEVMEFSADGGSGEITWEEKMRDVTRSTPYEFSIDTDAEWITISYGAVSDCCADITVDANSAEAREGKIVITYRNYNEQVVEVLVKQAVVGDTPQTEASLKIDVQEVHAASAITQVTPSDSGMYYVMFLDEVSYFEFNGITSAEQLWEDDYAAFESGALANNMNLKAYMEAANVLFKGRKRVQWNSVRPGTESVLYVYGVKFSEDGALYEPVTDIAWEVICPDRAPLQDVAFGLDVEVDGAELKLDVNPENWDGY